MQGLQISVGRDPKCDWVVEPKYGGVSSRHLTITEQLDDKTRLPMCYLLEDYSTNGTFVNAQQVHNGTYYIRQGDHITLGREYELNWDKLMRYFTTSKTQKKVNEQPVEEKPNQPIENNDSQATELIGQFSSADPVYEKPISDYIPQSEPTDGIQVNEEVVTEQAQRHGFITFWLILLIIGNSISIIAALALGVFSYLSIFAIALNIVSIVSVVMLLQWKKIGFWIFLGCQVLAAVLNATMQISEIAILSAVGAVLGVAILWGILQIKKDGKSCWEQLN